MLVRLARGMAYVPQARPPERAGNRLAHSAAVCIDWADAHLVEKSDCRGSRRPLCDGSAFRRAGARKAASSTPKEGGTVAASLSEIELDFSAPLRVTALHVRDAAEHDVALKGELPKAFAAVLKLGVGALAPGAYHLSWTAVGEDGHVMKGAIAFTVVTGQPPAK